MPVFEDSGKFRGQAFIEFDSVESATKAVEYNNTEVDGRTVWIDFALPRSSGGSRGGGGRGGRGGKVWSHHAAVQRALRTTMSVGA